MRLLHIVLLIMTGSIGLFGENRVALLIANSKYSSLGSLAGPVVATDLDLIEQAIDISAMSQLSYSDSLIVAAAEKANCEFLFSEDLNTGQTYRGVVALNPFKKEDF